jgi:hypothetical protein
VAVVFLEETPDPSTTSPVLSYGSGVFATGSPFLTGSRTRLSIVIARDAFPTSVHVQPAQVSIGDRLELEGSSLAGTTTTLQLRDEGVPRPVDPSLWAVVATTGRVYATPTPALGDADLLPGLWNASVLVRRDVSIGGVARPIAHASNETPILITPRFDTVAPAGPTLGTAAPGAVVVWTGWLFAHERIPLDERDPGSLRVYVAGQLVDPADVVVVDPRTLQVTLPPTLASGSVVTVQVAVRGAFSAPQWLGVA